MRVALPPTNGEPPEGLKFQATPDQDAKRQQAPPGDASPNAEAPGDSYMRQRPLTAAFETFETWADVYEFLDNHKMTLEDAERTIRRACSLTPDGATKDEVVHYFRMTHGIPTHEAGMVEFIAAFLAHRRKIKRTHGKYNAPPPEQRVLALVAVPPADYGMIEPYIHRGTAAFVEET